MSQDDTYGLSGAPKRHSLGAAVLAENAVSIVKQRQAYTANGARQFIVDHVIQAVLSKTAFHPDDMLSELYGHRLSTDAVIDIYIPATARGLGDKWMTDEVDFASVTVGSMRLQALLSVASAENMDFVRPLDNTLSALIVVPLGEQHTLGAFVLAAQLRRFGAQIDMSFCETSPELSSRLAVDPPDILMFTASCRATLETVAHLVLDICNLLPNAPKFALGGSFAESDEKAKDISGVDMVTRHARDALAFVTRHKRSGPEKSTL